MAELPPKRLIARAYQQEMFEVSIKENTIVVMPTGSGKTQVAIMRIKYELNRTVVSKKIVWFIAPTVALCRQQYDTIAPTILPQRSKIIVGEDNVDSWKDQKLWNYFLDCDLIVSTPAILRDALNHGFVRMEKLSLLIFDEAHHCQKRSDMNGIMRDHYLAWPKGSIRPHRPHILGLTASPGIRAKTGVKLLQYVLARRIYLLSIDANSDLQHNLNSVCRRPQIHRDELLQHTPVPDLVQLRYSFVEQQKDFTPDKNPVLKLPTGMNEPHLEPLRSSLGLSIPWQDQDKLSRSFATLQMQLGIPAAEGYIYLVQQRICDPSRVVSTQNSEAFGRILSAGSPSDKVRRLARFLSDNMDSHSSTIIFVEQRVVTVMLCHLLRTLPATSRFSTASFVGAASHIQRRSDASNIVSNIDQKRTLQDFRSGDVRILICTSVAEEGLDIQSCNIVVRFDLPQNLKAYVQSRGRARMRASSQYVMLIDSHESEARVRMLQQAEQEMLHLMTVARLEHEDLRRRENDASAEEGVSYSMSRTGAKLTMDRAPQYLQHFCSRYRSDIYTSAQPIYRHSVDTAGFFQGVVELPGGLDESLRCHTGRKTWLSQRSARRDAAFQAIITLHGAGLVDDHLLPMPLLDSSVWSGIPSGHSSPLEVSAQLNPWLLGLLSDDRRNNSMRQLRITLSRPGFDTLTLFCISTAFPTGCPASAPAFYPQSSSLCCETPDAWVATFDHVSWSKSQQRGFWGIAKQVTRIILNGSTTKSILEETHDPALVLVPACDIDSVETWIKANHGSIAAADAYNEGQSYAVVRFDWDFRRPRIIRDWPSLEMMTSDALPRRRNFLSATKKSPSKTSALCQISKQAEREAVLAHEWQSTEGAMVDRLHVDNICWSMILPSVLHHLTHEAIASRLFEVLLRPLGLPASSLIREAITAPSAEISPNYQALEFVGDTILKFAVTLNLYLRYPRWHEGYLTAHRSRLVSNTRLAQVAIDKDLSRYIITEPFAARRWMPTCLPESSHTTTDRTRQLSSKCLADVVEALLGAVYTHSGLADTLTMIGSFLPEFDVDICSKNCLLQARPTTEPTHNSTLLDTLQRLIGRVFVSPTLLLQAITHPTGSDITKVLSYQRLEFLGDAVLDLLITKRLARLRATLSHVRMHLIRSTLVNAHMLAFWCMSLVTRVDDFNVIYREKTESYEAVPHAQMICLAQCLRFHHDRMGSVLEACLIRFQGVQREVTNAIRTGPHHPWSLLTSINAPKFVSDMIESILGAILVDTLSDLQQCQSFLDVIGLTGYLDRLLTEHVVLHHPKTLLAMRASSKVIYTVRVPDASCKSYQCIVEIASEPFARVSHGVSQEHVVTMAAEEALKNLQMSY